MSCCLVLVFGPVLLATATERQGNRGPEAKKRLTAKREKAKVNELLLLFPLQKWLNSVNNSSSHFPRHPSRPESGAYTCVHTHFSRRNGHCGVCSSLFDCRLFESGARNGHHDHRIRSNKYKTIAECKRQKSDQTSDSNPIHQNRHTAVQKLRKLDATLGRGMYEREQTAVAKGGRRAEWLER